MKKLLFPLSLSEITIGFLAVVDVAAKAEAGADNPRTFQIEAGCWSGTVVGVDVEAKTGTGNPRGFKREAGCWGSTMD